MYDIVAQYEMLTLGSPLPSGVLTLDWLTLKQVRPQQRACSEASSALPSTKLSLGLSDCNVRLFGVCAAVRKSRAKLGGLLLLRGPVRSRWQRCPGGPAPTGPRGGGKLDDFQPQRVEFIPYRSEGVLRPSPTGALARLRCATLLGASLA
jgi:hypothetical protein